MMTLFIGGIIFLGIVIVICIILLIRLSKNETLFMEVSNQYLKDIGKDYTRDQYAMAIFDPMIFIIIIY